MTDHSIKQDKNNLKYRITFLNLNGEILVATEFSSNREAMAHLVDEVNRRCRYVRAHIETRASGNVLVPY
jgi:uncharacterized protein YegP (UPF0339 family)